MAESEMPPEEGMTENQKELPMAKYRTAQMSMGDDPKLAAAAAAEDAPLVDASYEVDVDLPPASTRGGNPSSPKKEVSLLGSSLTSKPAQREGKTLNQKGAGRPRRPIVDRYAYEVREADRNRKIAYLPMEVQIQYTPSGRDVMRDMRDDLHDLTRAIGGAHLVSKVPGSKDYETVSPVVKLASGKEACQVCGNAWLPNDTYCRKCGKRQPGIGWDVFLTQERFQKRMQYLHQHARTGHFIEQYGAEGQYEGEFLTGMRHGKGKYEFRDEVYDGEWKWDQRHGWGELKCSDGLIIKGEWQNDKPNGYATVTDPSKSPPTVIYEGEFKDGKRHGLGRQLFENGHMYDGGWLNGRLHDRGVYYFANGDRLYGMWNEGIYDGIAVLHYADGSISRREYRNGLLMSVQDYEHTTQRFGKTLTRGGMQKHTRDRDFPKEVFLLNSV